MELQSVVLMLSADGYRRTLPSLRMSGSSPADFIVTSLEASRRDGPRGDSSEHAFIQHLELTNFGRRRDPGESRYFRGVYERSSREATNA